MKVLLRSSNVKETANVVFREQQSFISLLIRIFVILSGDIKWNQITFYSWFLFDLLYCVTKVKICKCSIINYLAEQTFHLRADKG